MELLRGRDLALLLQQNGALPIEHAADYVRQAADAIACAHAQGIVHRDLKPSNLFLTQRSDGAPLVKVLDFGISKTTQNEFEAATGNLTMARSVLGTPFYMSPEQIRDAKQVDFRTDIWSLGLILHELLSGAPAFEGSTLPGVCAAIAADPPAALRLKRPDVPVELEAIVLKCLEKDATKRFQDVRELAAKLVPFCGRMVNSSLLPLAQPVLGSAQIGLDITARQESATIVVPASSGAGSAPGGDGATMPSAVLVQSGEVMVVGRTPFSPKSPQTLSAALISASPLQQETASSSAPRRSLWLVGAGLFALTALGAWALRGSSVDAPLPARSVAVAPASIAPPPAPSSASFALEIAASEPGARVYEGENLLGSTPLRMTVEPASVAQGPRTFTVRKSGFLPYTIVQGPSQKDARVLAELAAEPAATPPAGPKAKPRKAPPPPKAVSPSPSPKPANSPSDIFMQR